MPEITAISRNDSARFIYIIPAIIVKLEARDEISNNRLLIAAVVASTFTIKRFKIELELTSFCFSKSSEIAFVKHSDPISLPIRAEL